MMRVCLFVFLLIIISCKNEENKSDFEEIPHYSSSASRINHITSVQNKFLA